MKASPRSGSLMSWFGLAVARQGSPGGPLRMFEKMGPGRFLRLWLASLTPQIAASVPGRKIRGRFLSGGENGRFRADRAQNRRLFRFQYLAFARKSNGRLMCSLMEGDRSRFRAYSGRFPGPNSSCLVKSRQSAVFFFLRIEVVTVARLRSVQLLASTLRPAVSSLLFSKPLKTHAPSVRAVGLSGPMLARFHHLKSTDTLPIMFKEILRRDALPRKSARDAWMPKTGLCDGGSLVDSV